MQCRFLLLLASWQALAALDGSEGPPLDTDDECAANATGAACALIALQRRGVAVAGPQPAGAAHEAADAEGPLGISPPPRLKSHRYMATTTRYGNNSATSCELDSRQLVLGTEYYAVASSQAMQDGCCNCNLNGGGGETASLGCGSCARGRFIPIMPQGFRVRISADAEIFTKEYKVIIADVCPFDGNEGWCQRNVGAPNKYGTHNHFDWASPPHNFDNYYFEFTPMECSGEMKRRYAKLSRCPNKRQVQQHHPSHQDAPDDHHDQHGHYEQHNHHDQRGHDDDHHHHHHDDHHGHHDRHHHHAHPRHWWAHPSRHASAGSPEGNDTAGDDFNFTEPVDRAVRVQ